MLSRKLMLCKESFQFEVREVHQNQSQSKYTFCRRLYFGRKPPVANSANKGKLLHITHGNFVHLGDHRSPIFSNPFQPSNFTQWFRPKQNAGHYRPKLIRFGKLGRLHDST